MSRALSWVSHVKPSPHGVELADVREPFGDQVALAVDMPPLMNCTTAQGKPCAIWRKIMPKARRGFALALARVDDDQALSVGLGGHDLVAGRFLFGHLGGVAGQVVLVGHRFLPPVSGAGPAFSSRDLDQVRLHEGVLILNGQIDHLLAAQPGVRCGPPAAGRRVAPSRRSGSPSRVARRQRVVGAILQPGEVGRHAVPGGKDLRRGPVPWSAPGVIGTTHGS